MQGTHVIAFIVDLFNCLYYVEGFNYKPKVTINVYVS